MARYNRMNGGPDARLDTTPVEMPLGASRPTPLQDLIARMVREAVAVEKGEEFESWEESEDFEEEDPDTLDLSRYELQDVESAYDPSYDPLRAPEAPIEAPQEKIGDPPDLDAEEPEK